MSRTPGMARHSNSSFDEAQEIRIVSGLLESHRTIKTFFKENDRTPNHDGFFELVENELPFKQFIVQIKKIDNLPLMESGKNKGKYVYSMDTTFLYYVKAKVAESPAIYFVVDLNTEKVFWKYLSDEYLMTLDFEGHATIDVKFDETDILTDINDFTTIIKRISFERNSKFVNKSPEEIAEIQESTEWLNEKIMQLPFLKDVLPTGFWRFGIACTQNTPVSIKLINQGGQSEQVEQKLQSNRTSCFAVYPQIKGKLDSGVKEFDAEKDKWLVHMDFTGETTPMEYVKSVLGNLLDVYFNKGLFAISKLPAMVLNEVAFAFLDKVARYNKNFASTDKCSSFNKDAVSLKEFGDLLCGYLDYMNYILTVDLENKEEIVLKEHLDKILIRPYYFSGIDAVSIISTFGCSKYVTANRPASEISLSIDMLLGILSQEYRLFWLTFLEMKKRNLSVVERVWDFRADKSVEEDLKLQKNSFISKYYFYDQQKFENAIDTWLCGLPNLYNEVFSELNISKDFYYTTNVKYNFCKEQSFHGDVYTFNMKFYKNTGEFKVQRDKSIDNNRNYSEDGVKSFSWGICFDDILLSSTPLYNSLKALFYQGIARKLQIECKGICVSHGAQILFEK